MQITKLCSGSYHLQFGDEAILAGCPPEVVKILLQKKLSAPNYLLIPDKPIQQGESQVAIEFPLYHHLFFRHGGNPREPHLCLIGSEHRVTTATELVDLTLFGPDRDQLSAWGMDSDEAANLFDEMSWFHLKNKSGSRMPIEDLVKRKILEDNPVELATSAGPVSIKRESPNRFSITHEGHTEIIDLNFNEEQEPPYPVTIDLFPAELVKFGITVLGGSTGFSATQASSGLAVCYNGNFMLIDAIPYLNHHLRARGIARSQIQSIFLSHIHDDHCNLLSLLQYNKRVTVLTNPVIFRMMLQKLSLVMDRSVDSLRSYFEFIPLEPGTETNFFGLKIKPFWSIHSIPTLGAIFEASHSGKNYTITFTGDTQSLSDISEMHAKGIISKDRYKEIEDCYTQSTDVLLADGGEGMIHGDPGDALKSPAERVVFMHLDDLSEEFQAHFNIAQSGKRYTVVEGNTDYNLTRTIEFLLEYFPEMPSKWISNLLGDQRQLRYNSGDIIIREGTQSQGAVYMILSGYAKVIRQNGKSRRSLADVEAGELIGEMSVLTGKGLRNASVVAVSPVTVTEFSDKAFLDFIRHQGFEEGLKHIYENRNYLQEFPMLGDLPQKVLRTIAQKTLNVQGTVQPHPQAGSLVFPIENDIITPEGNTLAAKKDVLFIKNGHVPNLNGHSLMLPREEAMTLCRQIPVFRFYWEERLGLTSFFEK